MTRRKFLKQAVAGAAAGTLLGCTAEKAGGSGPAVHTNPKVTWRLASSFPRSLDTIFGAADQMATRIAELTDNKFRIRVFPGGEVVPNLQVLDAVQQGTVQCGHTAGYYYKGKNPAMVFDCTLPFGLTARQQIAWLYQGGGLELMRELYADFNIINFPAGNTGAQMGGWFRNEVNDLTDLKGLKMRIPGLGGEVMSRLGATVQVLGGGDIYPALERGAIDATEWVGPYDDEKLGFYKVARFYYYPGWWEPGPSLSLYVNRTAWEKLPPLYQKAIEVASAEANMGMLAKYDALNPPALARLLEQGVQMRPFSEPLLEAAHKTAAELIQEHASEPGYKKIHDAWKKFRKESYAWFAIGEESYSSFAFKRD